MPINNQDTILAGLQLNQDTHGNFLTDAVSSPQAAVGAVEAVAADVGFSFYNLAAAVSPLPNIPEDKVVGLLAGLGLNDAASYTQNHPDAVHLAGLVAGSWNIGNLGAKLTLKLAQRGEILATDSGAMISKTMAKKQAVKDILEHANTGSAELKLAIKEARTSARIDGAIGGIGNIAAGDLAMSQSFALQDATPTDYALSLVVGGAGGAFLGAVPKILKDVKVLTGGVAQEDYQLIRENTARIPVQLKGSIGEATYIKATDTALQGKLPELNERQASIVKQQTRIHQSQIIDLVHSNTAKALLPVRGEARNNPNVYDFAGNLQRALVDGVDNMAAVAGVRKVKVYNPDLHVALGDDHIGELALQHEISSPAMKNLTDMITGLQRSGQWNFVRNETVKQLAKQLKIPEVAVDQAEKLLNSSIIDTRTGMVHDLVEGQKIATAQDLGIKSVVKGEGISAGQQQYNNLQELRKGARTLNGSQFIRVEDIQKADFSTVLGYKAVLVHGGLRNDLAATSPKLLSAVNTRITSEVQRLKDAGQGTMEIALRTHTDFKKLEELALKGKLETPSELFLPMDRDSLEFADHKALAVLEGDTFLGQGTLERAAALDHQLTGNLNKEFRDTFATSNESETIRSLWEYANGGVGAAIEKGLADLNPALYHDNTFLSADMAYRHQGKITNNIVAFGARALDILHKGVKDTMKPLHVLASPILAKQDLIVSWNKSEAALRSVELFGEDTLAIHGKQLGVLNGKDFTPLENAKGEQLGNLPSEVLDFWDNVSTGLSTEVRNQINFNRGLSGQSPALPRGIKLPPRYIADKHLAYAIDPTTDAVTMYHATTQDGIEGLIKSAREQFPEREILTQASDLERFNVIHDHVSVGIRKVADFNQHKGSTTFASVSATKNQLQAFMDDSVQHLTRLGRMNMRLMNPEAVSHLRLMDELSNGGTNLYQDLERTAFGGSVLARHDLVSKVNDVFTGLIDRGLNILDGNFGHGTRYVFDKVGNKILPNRNKLSTHEQVANIFSEFSKSGLDKGQLPWANQMEALAQTQAYEKLGDRAGSVVATNNFLMAGLSLRFIDLSHALVTMLSVPLTTMPEAMLTAGNFAGMKHMMEGVFRAYIPAFRGAMKKIEEAGITKPEVSEANDFLANTIANPKLTDRIENNPVFHALQKPSEWAEANSRRVAAATAHSIYEANHGAGTGVSGEGLAFISAFVKRSMGNYTTAQRPALFQGTFGAAIGLFQTYVWTMGQMAFRGIEADSKLPLATLLTAQTASFGLRSLPGYDILNHYVGTHYGNADNVDITTHIYEGAGKNSTAETLLYGAASTLLNTSLWTRGVVTPRSPITVDPTTGGVSITPAALSPIMDSMKAIKDIADRVTNGATVPDSIATALQLQSLSRPIARAADVYMGHSIDQRGGTVDPDAHFKFNLATFARATASRPLHEQLIRDLSYQQSYYNSANRDAKGKLLKALRANIQNGRGQGDALMQYMNLGGSVSGFRSALNKIYIEDRLGKIGTLDDSRLKLALDQGVY